MTPGTIELRKQIFMSFYDQMDEPERSYAINNFDEGRGDPDYLPQTVGEAILHGFSWDTETDDPDYWDAIHDHYVNKYGKSHSSEFSIKELAEEMYPMDVVKITTACEVYDKLNELGKIRRD